MSAHMITFHCHAKLFRRLESFSRARNIDRTSVLKLALHYYMNRNLPAEGTAATEAPPKNTPAPASE